MSDDTRDPEAMLARLRTEEPQNSPTDARRRGRLKIFFGYAAGVGKTYSMLEAAKVAAAGQKNILLGYIEPHERPETEALMIGLPTLPRSTIDYRGVTLFEFDLDTALERKPDVVLVDELAHTNAPGSRHRKRWQDVEELLDAGIDVWTTLNVQHVESLNDIVTSVTGIVVRETIPDHVFDEADDVELVDLPPDDLLHRLREGKVYMPDQARQAVERFFRKANLIALRELAMRRLADRVGQDVQTARLGHARATTWPTTECLLVCVGPSPTSSRVIRTAKRMASAMHAQWIAVSTETASSSQSADPGGQRVAQHLKLAESLGAETVTITGEDVAEELVRYAQSRNVTKIVIGKTGQTHRYRFWRRSVVDRLIAMSGDIDVHVIHGSDEEVSESTPHLGKVPRSWRGFAAAAAALSLATAMALGFRAVGLTEPNIVMTYLLAVVAVAVWLGRDPAILASFLAVLLFNFFFTRPYYTFVVHDSQYIYTFTIMLLVSLVVSALTVRLRRQITIAREQERRTEVHYRMSRALAQASGRLQLARVAQEQLATILGGGIVMFAKDDASLHPLVHIGNDLYVSPMDLEAALWVFEHGKAAGLGTDTLPNCRFLLVPLQGADVTIGVLGWCPHEDSDLLSIECRRLFDTFADQIALALEHDRLAQEAQRILAEAEAERLRSSLLSAVSHDLRTPLAAIAGSASALLEQQLDTRTRTELARTIYDESDRLLRLVENLLHLTRIESGHMKVAKQWQSLDEVVGSALHRLKAMLERHRVETFIPSDLGFVPFDGILMEQLLVNLLENASKYAPAGSEIGIRARRISGGVEVAVEDQGPGVHTDERERVFDRFYRSSRVSSDRGRGAGLGLSICKAVVKAHGGHIRAEGREGGGARIVFTLPLEGMPPGDIDNDGTAEDVSDA